jgi:hypothetical protein
MMGRVPQSIKTRHPENSFEGSPMKDLSSLIEVKGIVVGSGLDL